jgi:hypothetical protein
VSNIVTFNVVNGSAAALLLSGSVADLASTTQRTFTATIEDGAGNLITTGVDSNLTVTFAKTAGSGTVTGLGSRSASGGVASITVTGGAAGPISLRASITGSNGPVQSIESTFDVVAAAGAADRIVLSAASVNVVTGGQQVLTATIQDNAGNPIVAGADASLNVTFTQTAGSGSVSGLTAKTATNGVAKITVLGGAIGDVVVRASATGSSGLVQSILVTFNVVAVSSASSCYSATINAELASVSCQVLKVDGNDRTMRLTTVMGSPARARVQADVVFHGSTGLPPSVIAWTYLR